MPNGNSWRRNMTAMWVLARLCLALRPSGKGCYLRHLAPPLKSLQGREGILSTTPAHAVASSCWTGTCLRTQCGVFLHFYSDAIFRSSEMVSVMQQKLRSLKNTSATASQGSVEATGLADDSFDTVIDTFGLCSVSNGETALREMGRVCKASGQILLLEHGRSEYQFINRFLDARASNHARDWGCWVRCLDFESVRSHLYAFPPVEPRYCRHG